MNSDSDAADAVIIGGGFYGCVIALYLAKTRGLRRVLVLEREPRLLIRASHNNQARVHNGYHYPRSFTTAFRSRVNLPRFVRDWPDVVKRDFTKLYAVARRNSKVTARQFERFCREIGATIRPADPDLARLFEPRLVEAVFLAEEYAFDASRLAAWAERELASTGVEVRFLAHAVAISRSAVNELVVAVRRDRGDMEFTTCRYVFNCTYSGLNQLSGEFPGTQTVLRHEVAEMALVEPPPPLKDVGVTIMDGSFFSMMPFPSRGLHTLSHVRYTPHFSWEDSPGIDPYARLAEYDRETRADRMLRDAARYLPCMQHAAYRESLFEVKTVLVRNEADDGRPILFEKHGALPGCYSVLGGKIDNIYDVLEKLDSEQFTGSPE